MNISTGGPHVLLFERDQQLAVLLTSELQLAGYECHIARTAVEVFDAIARFPVRLVLVNLAQAAASRREFWVALDTQRRGSGIQVFTFHCSNLAGYGPRDPDDYGQASMADMEVDGMVGLMKLVDTVRARVPGAEGNASTAPRIPRTPTHNDSPDPQSSTRGRFSGNDHMSSSANRAANRPLPQPSVNTSGTSAMPNSQEISQAQPLAAQPSAGNQAGYSDKIRAVLYPNPNSSSPHSGVGVKGNNGGSPWYGSYVDVDTPRSHQPQVPPPATSSGTSVLQRLANGQIYSSPGLAELSRLVSEYKSSGIQPNPVQPIAYQTWGTESVLPPSNMRIEQVGNQTLTYRPPDLPNDSPGTVSPVPPLSPTETSGRGHVRNFQLSSPPQLDVTAGSPTVLRAAPIEDLPLERPTGSQPAYGVAIKPLDGLSQAKEPLPPQTINKLPFPSQPSLGSITPATANWPIESSSTGYAPPPPLVRPTEEAPVSRKRENVLLTPESAYQKEVAESRYADRTQRVTYQKEPTETLRQPDRLQQSYQREVSEPSQRPDPSQRRENAEPSRQQSNRMQEQQLYQRENAGLPRHSDRVQEQQPYQRENRHSDRVQEQQPYQRENRHSDRVQEQQPYQRENRHSERSQEQQPYQRENAESSRQSDRVQEPLQRSSNSQEPVYHTPGKEIDESTDGRNAVILDILQSLPAVATPSGQQEQAIQPQVHNGRATRALGDVLLDGHLVPQDRLEVAQNIQRMLRGVDMNYQLGEILLMFKLLTPDQLLAASLVGYGLITRTQISALGRIRQELHAIGLEYDLENLVILFRILTPEQVREARSSIRG